MAGGQGTRFWPESTSKKAKQYLKLTGENSLLFESLQRFVDLVPVDRRFVVTVKAQENLAREHSKNLISDDGIIFEPAGRNTAPCILLSLAWLLEKGAGLQDVVAIVPSDHVILNKVGFQKVIHEAFELAVATGDIFTIGVPPVFPHTGYGYILKGKSIRDGVFKVKEFKEKPSFEIAKQYVESGNYFWNAGMFVGSIGTFLEEFEKLAPSMFCHFVELRRGIADGMDLKTIYEKIPRDSIDFAVMEKSNRVSVIAARFDWNDLGSWDALESVVKKQNGNVIIQSRDVFLENAKGNIIFCPDKFVSLINVTDLIVVANDNVIMILPKKEAQKVKNIVEYLKRNPLGEELL